MADKDKTDNPIKDTPSPVGPAAPASAIQLSIEQLEALLARVAGGARSPAEATEVAAETYAFAMKKALRPENERHPDVSVFNPKGERDHPRPHLPCEYFYNQMPLDRNDLTVDELTLLLEVQPGRYAITKTDDSEGTVEVFARRTGTGRIDQVHVCLHAVDHDARMNWPNFKTVLTQMVAQDPQAYMDPRARPQRVASQIRETWDLPDVVAQGPSAARVVPLA
jgi:hypothetical protein